MQLWWRRQTYRLRQLSVTWFFLTLICTLFLIISVPNPFSAEYSRLPIDQDAHWDNVNELLTIKERVCFLIFDNKQKQKNF